MTLSLKEVPLFQGLFESELNSIKACLKEKSFDKGEILFYEGKGCERVFIVQSGRIKIYRTASSGREQILETLGPGDTCACNPGAPTWSCATTSEALTPVTVWFLSREDYVKMVNTNSKVSHALNRLFAEKLRCFSSLIEEVSLKDVKKRLVKFLLDMLAEETRPSRREDTLFIPFTREEIAQRLGTARETVARYLYQLKRAKLIDIKPHQIIICNKAGLEKLLQ
ncbi:MAG: Crp/Fnr family transcriptional regulator [Candidatus Omnitrophica bacterium]|nr:Crp/Fnr family transcriptional regulator [Candidatus Omnitrophota bacterium]